MDFLRAFSILAVVLGHWLIAVIYWEPGRVGGDNALSLIGWAWILTWFLQVMPLFFFVGGFSNATALSGSSRDYVGFVDGRVRRLMRPTMVFGAVWIVVGNAVALAGVSDVEMATKLVARPLWFVGVYLAVIALAPPMLRLHRRFGVWAAVALVVGAVIVDLCRFTLAMPGIGYVNYAFVWLFAQQLGFLYRDGALKRLTARGCAALAGIGLGGMLLLVNVGPYPGSMVGVPGDRLSNMDPPTVCIVALTLWEVGLALLARPALARWLQRPRAWAGVVWVNTVIMTIFLWHLSALLIGVLIAFPLGFPQPEAGTWRWWATRPLWIAILSVILLGFVLVFGRFEHPKARGPAPERSAPGPRQVAAAAVGVAFVVLAVLGYAFTGFDRFASSEGDPLLALVLNPFQSLLHLGAGFALLKAATVGPRAVGRLAAPLATGLALLALADLWATHVGAWNVLALNPVDGWLHLALAVAVGILALVPARLTDRRVRAEPKP
jgi:hypothetical protein